MNAKGTNQALEAREGLSPRWGYPPSLVKRGYVGTPPKNFENLDCRRWLLGCSEQILTSNPWCKIAHFQELIFLKYETEIIFGIDVHMIVSLTYSPFHTYTLTQEFLKLFFLCLTYIIVWPYLSRDRAVGRQCRNLRFFFLIGDWNRLLVIFLAPRFPCVNL